MSQLEHHLSRWLDTTLPLTSCTLDSWVGFTNYIATSVTCLTFHFLLSGGDKGSGSEWFYDGGKLVRRSMIIGKPLIVVACK